MSLSGYGAVEFMEGGRWWHAATFTFYGDVTCFRVLGDPWQDESEGVRSAVPLRGAPSDLSIIVAEMRREGEPWKAATTLTVTEIGTASAIYYNTRGQSSREIVSIEAFMRAFRAARPTSAVPMRLVMWWY